MYFKPIDNRTKISVPIGYKGTAFSPPKEEKSEILPKIPLPAPQKTPITEIKEPPQKIEIPDEKQVLRPVCENCEICETKDNPPERKSSHGLLSADGIFDAEELLILALALIVFQGGKETELAFLLLALLFIK